ncbi:MAG: hypothetical protein HYR63_20330 [Proteobacteria bacterium]|nr:hypothetical protein [Pseudomonadota bacterium]MBI3497049.1 hypothetical protein [Pseudomonadota bacterium]
MSDRVIDWPLGESSSALTPYSAETSLAREGADWGPAARAILGPHLRYFAPIPAPHAPARDPGREADWHLLQFRGGV